MGKNKKRKNKVEKAQKPEEIQKGIPLTDDSDSETSTENDMVQFAKENDNPALNDVQTAEELPEKAPAEITEEHSEENVEDGAPVIAKENNTKTKRKKKDNFAFKKISGTVVRFHTDILRSLAGCVSYFRKWEMYLR